MSGSIAAGRGERVRITGLNSTVRQLKAVEKDSVVEVKQLNLATARIVAADAVGRAPVMSGKLAASIRMRATATSGSVVAGGAAIPYAPPIHWGWPDHNISPQPFMYEALDARRPDVLAAYERGIKIITERVHGGGL